MSIFAFNTESQNIIINKNMSKLDSSLIPTELENAVKNRNRNKVFKIYQQNPELCKKLLHFLQQLKLSYNSYSRHLCRCNIKINWSSNFNKKFITFHDSVYLYRYMIMNGRNNSYLNYIDFTLGTFLQQMKLILFFISRNRQACPKFLRDWLLIIDPNSLNNLCGSNVSTRSYQKISNEFIKFNIS